MEQVAIPLTNDQAFWLFDPESIDTTEVSKLIR